MRTLRHGAFLGKPPVHLFEFLVQWNFRWPFCWAFLIFDLSYPVSVLGVNQSPVDLPFWIILVFFVVAKSVKDAKDNQIDLETGAEDIGSYSVVIPVYNEEDGIIPVLTDIVHAVEGTDAEVIIVDDGSSDQTIALAENFVKAQTVRFHIVRHPQNQGYGSALKTGFERANNEVITFLDADGTYPATHIPAMIRLFRQKNLDILVGVRLRGTECKMPWIRKVGNRLFAFLMSLYSGTRVSDVGSGMRVMNRSLLNEIGKSPDGLFFTPYMSAQVLLQGINYGEIPIPYHERIGFSKLRVIQDGWNFFKAITIPSWRKRPIRVFLILAFFFLALFAIITAVGLLLFRYIGYSNIII